jgi:hypothetical protein
MWLRSVLGQRRVEDGKCVQLLGQRRGGEVEPSPILIIVVVVVSIVVFWDLAILVSKLAVERVRLDVRPTRRR